MFSIIDQLSIYHAMQAFKLIRSGGLVANAYFISNLLTLGE